ncbi:hypothetical protein LM599_07415 [Candidatus Acetothermia bacterium]|jgi:hypothetical protein|nr:hypothetical protein [Candidatus Acetothermia bacterium]
MSERQTSRQWDTLYRGTECVWGIEPDRVCGVEEAFRNQNRLLSSKDECEPLPFDILKAGDSRIKAIAHKDPNMEEIFLTIIKGGKK